MPAEQWQTELGQCIRTLGELERYLPLPNKAKLQQVIGNMRLSITPHTLSLINWQNPNDPILLMSVPHERELDFQPEELVDPIGDDAKSPVPFLTHRYPDRVLIYATFFCSLFCRFCFRRSKTGEANPGPGDADLARIINYLKSHTEVEEVIFTGGDPLTLLDWQIEEWLQQIRAIPSIHRIRFHTRVPVNLPSRITDNLIAIFKRYQDATHPIFIVTHFNHPQEIAPANIDAIAKLVNAGLVVRNQGPLLAGINDNADTLELLFKKLTDIRVVPYYLHQLDLARGTNHFRVPIKRGQQIMRTLQGRCTGIALPRYMLDLPGGHGKIPLTPNFAEHTNTNTWRLTSPFGIEVEYHEPLVE